MKRTLLVAALLASSSLAAHAACNPSPPPPVPDPGNLVTFQCDSDNQATDADDLKMFIDKATGVTDVEGSLNKNSKISTLPKHPHHRRRAVQPGRQRLRGTAFRRRRIAEQRSAHRDVHAYHPECRRSAGRGVEAISWLRRLLRARAGRCARRDGMGRRRFPGHFVRRPSTGYNDHFHGRHRARRRRRDRLRRAHGTGLPR